MSITQSWLDFLFFKSLLIKEKTKIVSKCSWRRPESSKVLNKKKNNELLKIIYYSRGSECIHQTLPYILPFFVFIYARGL